LKKQRIFHDYTVSTIAVATPVHGIRKCNGVSLTWETWVMCAKLHYMRSPWLPRGLAICVGYDSYAIAQGKQQPLHKSRKIVDCAEKGFKKKRALRKSSKKRRRDVYMMDV
jgi:hypothetical protein